MTRSGLTGCSARTDVVHHAPYLVINKMIFLQPLSLTLPEISLTNQHFLNGVPSAETEWIEPECDIKESLDAVIARTGLLLGYEVGRIR